jgi:hypothetical protein
MKMSKELFSDLCDGIDAVISKHSLKVITEHRQNIAYTNDQFISFCWSMITATRMDYRLFYDAGLNDTHIETALKRILSDFA